MIHVTDDLGRELTLPRPAQRIVSLVPSLTETICVFGCAPQLLGVTRHCTMPVAELASTRRVGGTKNPDVTAIVELRPDMVIVNAEENRKEDFEALTAAGVSVFVSYPRRVADMPDLLRRLGVMLAADAAGESAACDLEAALASLAQPQARRRVFCPVWKNPWMTFNGDTFADDLLMLAGGKNVFRDRPDRYFEISLEEVAAVEPQVILLPDEPYVFQQKDLAALAPLSETPALRNQKVHLADGKALFWYGTRTASAIRDVGAIVAR